MEGTKILDNHTAVESANALFFVDSLQSRRHAFFRTVVTGHMCPRFDCDVRVGDGSSGQLSNRPEHETIFGLDFSTFLNHLLELFENGVLQNRIDDKNQGREDAGEESHEAILMDDFHECGDGARLLRLLRGTLALLGRQ